MLKRMPHASIAILCAALAATAAAGADESPALPPLELPRPAVELPELPWDKSELQQVQALDAMIVDAQYLAAAVAQFEQMYHALDDVLSVSMSGSNEDQIRAALAIVDGFERFDQRAVPFGRAAELAFTSEYESDEAFGARFRERFSLAEQELWDVIEDGPQRRATGAALTNGYRYAGGSNVAYLQRMLSESSDLRANALEHVIQSVETDLMVADYKKGRDLIDLLRAARSRLEVVRALDRGGERVDAILARVAEKEASRQAEIAEARAAYRFPARFDGANAPADAGDREVEMRRFLERSGYDVRGIVVASPWIRVDSLLGIHLYNQVDFYVASPSTEDPAVLDVLYVTGKTSGPEPGSLIGRYSVGTIAQMLAQNL